MLLFQPFCTKGEGQSVDTVCRSTDLCKLGFQAVEVSHEDSTSKSLTSHLAPCASHSHGIEFHPVGTLQHLKRQGFGCWNFVSFQRPSFDHKVFSLLLWRLRCENPLSVGLLSIQLICLWIFANFLFIMVIITITPCHPNFKYCQPELFQICFCIEYWSRSVNSWLQGKQRDLQAFWSRGISRHSECPMLLACT